MVYSFPIGSSTLEVEVTSALHLAILDALIMEHKFFINQLAHRVNASTREVYYALSQMRKAGIPLVGNQWWVHITSSVKELNDYIEAVRKRNVEIIKDGSAIIKGLRNTANMQTGILKTTVTPNIFIRILHNIIG